MKNLTVWVAGRVTMRAEKRANDYVRGKKKWVISNFKSTHALVGLKRYVELYSLDEGKNYKNLFYRFKIQ